MSAAAPAAGFPVLVAWRLPAACLAVALAVLGVVLREPLAAMVSTWSNNETYAHGWIIAPISLWLIWRRRDALRHLAPRPDALALPALGLLSLGWLVGDAAGVLLLEQYAAVAMLPALVWLLAGRELLREWIFPLGFLLLAVPFGDFLVPPLMDITADMTVNLVRATGVPVYREGLYFSLPSGNWSVVQACSGIRYLIASVTLGLLYAYLAYHTLWRRAAFVALAIAVPIVANGLRAYGIVMLGHISGMTLAVGVDHLIYGWLFFGLVMLALFWVGRFWQEPHGPPAPLQHRPSAGAAAPSAPWVAGYALAGLAVALAGPVWAAVTERPVGALSAELQLPGQLDGYRTVQGDLPAGWRPHYLGLDAEAASAFEAESGPRLGAFVGLYLDQREGRELVAWENSLTVPAGSDSGRWRSLGRAGSARIETAGGALDIPAWRLSDGVSELLVWRWFWVDGQYLTGELPVKLASAWARLSGGNDAGALLAVAVPVEPGQRADEVAPRQFMAALSTEMARRLTEVRND